MADASPPLCSRCRRHPPLAGTPFCAACLLTQVSPGKSREPTGTHVRHLAPGAAAGPYEIVELLGEGGFAEVYSARLARRDPADGTPRHIALKIIKRGMDSREILARFRAEQRTIQSLSHPHIVEPLDSGFTADGLPYFAMAQVDGLPVTDYCEAAGLSLADRLRLFLPVCDAVQHAHQKGVLHRDLKPSNLLVEETAAGPVPKVIDFGIARALEPGGTGDTHFTQLGQVLGTPAYMSPEQAAGNDGADTRSDIYSLGAVLYEMLTGCCPFDTAALGRLRPGDWARHLRENIPPLPSARLAARDGPLVEVRRLRGDLDLVVRKAMAPEPDRRYASAAAFAEDVQACLDDRPVSAHPPTVGELLRQFVRRHRWPVTVGVSILLGTVATAGVGTYLAIQARRAERSAIAQRNRALAAEGVADQAREQADRQNYQAAIEAAAIHLERGQPFLAAERLRATPARLRGWEWGYLTASIGTPEAAAESGLENPDCVAASPDGRFAAVAAGPVVVVVDTRANRIVARRTFDAKVGRLALSDDGARLAVIEAPPGSNLLRASLVVGGGEWSLPLAADTDIAWEPSAAGGALLLVSGNGPTPAPGRLARFDAGTGRVLNERPINRWKVHGRSLSIGPAGRLAVAENSFKDLEVFSLPDLRFVATDAPTLDEAVDAVLLDDRRDRLVVGRGSRIYDRPVGRDGGEPAGELVRPSAGGEESGGAGPVPKAARVRRLNWLDDGRWLAAGDGLGLVEGEKPRPLPLTGGDTLLPLAGGRVLAVARSGRLEIRPELSAVGPGQAVQAFFGGDYPEGRAVVFAADSRRVFFQGWPRDRLEAVPLGEVAMPRDPPPAARLPRQPEAEWAALPAVLADGTVLVRDGAGLAVVRPADGPDAPVPIPGTGGAWSADESADGRLLAVGVPAGVRLFDGKTHALLREWPLPGGPFRVLLPTPVPGRPAVVAISRESALHYLPVDGGAPSVLPMPFRVNGYYPAPMDFHRGSGLLAGAVESGFVVYDLRSLPSAPLLRRRCACAPVTALGFTRHTRRLAVGTEDHRLTLWDWEQALPLLSFPINAYCASVAFSPNGEWLAYTDYNPGLTLRRAESGPPGK